MKLGADSITTWIGRYAFRDGICQMIYTSKVAKLFNFTREKGVNRNIFGKKMRMLDVLHLYFDKFV